MGPKLRLITIYDTKWSRTEEIDTEKNGIYNSKNKRQDGVHWIY